MPSFDIVSEVDNHELTNAVDQANREVTTRFDFKDSGAKFSLSDYKITLQAASDFQIKQMQDILQAKLTKRAIDLKSLSFGEMETSLNEAKLDAEIKQGISAEQSKKLVKLIKDNKLKVQTARQGEQVRVTGKKRDDLQATMALLKDSEFEMPLQFTNFRD